MQHSRFHAKSTAYEVIEGHDLTNYETIVTGCTSGIGIETARALAKAGARVVIAARDMVRAEQVAKDIRETTKNDKVEVEKLELDVLASVKDFVKRYLAKGRPLHILINNAAIMGGPQLYTVDGFESQFGTNHMGHFALTIGLLPALIEGAKKSGRNSRVVNVSSIAHALSDIDLDDINFRRREYDRWASYGQSKTANILFSRALTKKYAAQGVLSNAVMPGGILTGLQKHVSHEEKISRGWIDEQGNINPDFKNLEQGASTTIWAAVDDEFANKGGLYLENCAISKLSNAKMIFTEYVGYCDYAFDDERAERLWNISMEWIDKPPVEAK